MQTRSGPAKTLSIDSPSGGAGASPHATLRAKALAYIDAHLLSESLTPIRLAEAIGVSRRKLYQLFEPEGGVAKEIMARRLEHAHKVLGDPAAYRRIKEVAYSHGFESDAHFSRCFKQRFGYSPSDLAARSRGPAAETD